MEVKEDICKDCEKYKTKKAKYVNESDSIFDAAEELYFFIHECQEVCTQAQEILNKHKGN